MQLSHGIGSMNSWLMTSVRHTGSNTADLLQAGPCWVGNFIFSNATTSPCVMKVCNGDPGDDGEEWYRFTLAARSAPPANDPEVVTFNFGGDWIFDKGLYVWHAANDTGIVTVAQVAPVKPA